VNHSAIRGQKMTGNIAAVLGDFATDLDRSKVTDLLVG
jgi:hypothetical protein